MVSVRRSKSKRRSKKRERKVYRRSAKGNSRSWKKNKPHSKAERQKVMKVCGPSCFGVPSTMKFPVCPKHVKKSSDCGPDCVGLIAAYRRANILKSKYPGLADTMRKKARRSKCKWVR